MSPSLRLYSIVLFAFALLARVEIGVSDEPKPAPSSTELEAKIDAYMKSVEAGGFCGSLLVAKGGKIVIEKGYGKADVAQGIPVTADTVFDIGSITKQFTASAILKLEMAGKLKVEDKIGQYLPGVPEDKASITIHHLLTHTAGLRSDFGGDYQEASRDWIVQKAMESKLLWAPGTKHRYANSGYSLLAAIVEIVSGESYEKFLHENLFAPAGMERTGYRLPKWKPGQLAHGYQKGGKDWGTPVDHPWAADGPYWNLRGNGGILSTVGDMYKWHLALEGTQVLSEGAKKKLFTPHVPEREGGKSFYGYGWAITETGRKTRLIWHNGGNGIFFADFRRYVDEGLVVLIMSSVEGQNAEKYEFNVIHLARGEEPQAAAPKSN